MDEAAASARSSTAQAAPVFRRRPNHVGFIPDGNRRWAAARNEPKRAGYAADIAPGLALLKQCRALAIAEVSVYGFTKENVHRPSDQVQAFTAASIAFAEAAIAANAALCVIGDIDSVVFPHPLRNYALERTPGDIRVNLLVITAGSGI